MGKEIYISAPIDNIVVQDLKSGDKVLINGTIYAARDAAHKKMVEMLERGEELPFDVEGQIIYYVGPCPEKPNEIIGSAGPTTSGRMDKYAPTLIKLGLKGMVGKGARDESVVDAMKKYKSIYFGAIGGLGALISKRIVSQEIIAFPELGAEALRKMKVKDFPAIVVIDSEGNNLYELGPNEYKK